MRGSVLVHAELYVHMMDIEGGQDANDLGGGVLQGTVSSSSQAHSSCMIIFSQLQAAHGVPSTSFQAGCGHQVALGLRLNFPISDGTCQIHLARRI